MKTTPGAGGVPGSLQGPLELLKLLELLWAEGLLLELELLTGLVELLELELLSGLVGLLEDELLSGSVELELLSGLAEV